MTEQSHITPDAPPSFLDESVPMLDDMPGTGPTDQQEEPEQSADSEENAAPLNKRPGCNFTDRGDWHRPGALENGAELMLPTDFSSEIDARAERMPNVNVGATPDEREWGNVLVEGSRFNTFANALRSTLSDPESEWNQGMTEGGRLYAGAAPKLAAPRVGQTYTGDQAWIRAATHLGLGTVFQAPMWNSGFWVTFRPPLESALLDLNRALMQDKILFGRSTSGLALSNTTVYTTDRVLALAQQHIFDITIDSKDMSLDDVLKYLNPQDIPSFIWGFICTMYPNGFNFKRACSHHPESCNHVTREVLNVHKLQWFNMRALTQWQRTHMSARGARSRKLADVIRYQEELAKMSPQTFMVDESKQVSISLGTPKSDQYINAGHRWISGIQELVDKTLGADADMTLRNQLITNHAKSATLRQYQHWFTSLTIGTNEVTDPEDIERQLELLSSDDDLRPRILEKVSNYIDQTTISVVGIPSYVCPACKGGNDPLKPGVHAKNILPLDVLRVFFGLFTQKVTKILQR